MGSLSDSSSTDNQTWFQFPAMAVDLQEQQTLRVTFDDRITLFSRSSECSRTKNVDEPAALAGSMSNRIPSSPHRAPDLRRASLAP